MSCKIFLYRVIDHFKGSLLVFVKFWYHWSEVTIMSKLFWHSHQGAPEKRGTTQITEEGIFGIDNNISSIPKTNTVSK